MGGERVETPPKMSNCLSGALCSVGLLVQRASSTSTPKQQMSNCTLLWFTLLCAGAESTLLQRGGTLETGHRPTLHDVLLLLVALLLLLLSTARSSVQLYPDGVTAVLLYFVPGTAVPRILAAAVLLYLAVWHCSTAVCIMFITSPSDCNRTSVVPATTTSSTTAAVLVLLVRSERGFSSSSNRSLTERDTGILLRKAFQPPADATRPS